MVLTSAERTLWHGWISANATCGCSTDTIEAVNSTLDLEEVLSLVATKVADALHADACFVYLYDERAGELVLRATHGTRVEEMTQRPRMRPGEGITGSAAESRAPVMIASQANLDPRFKNFPNLPEDEYESILAVPILARGERLEGALNVRTREPREFTEDEIDLLLAIAAQVAQSIEHAKLYEEAQRRVHELEALARISEAVSESLYLEESLEAIVKTTMDALSATGAALVLEDGAIAWPEGKADAHAIRQPLRWRGRQIGELVADRATPFTQDDRELLASIAQQAAVALEHGRAVMRGVLAQEIHHRVKNNLQTVASLLRLQARDAENVDPRKALEDSVNRILAIAAVHEVLTEQRDEDVDLAELLDRLRAMLVQGVGAGREVTAELEPVIARRQPRDRARARLLGAARQRARARRRITSASSCAARTARRARDRRRRRRDPRRADARGRASRSCARSFATSSAGRSSSTAAPARAPRALPGLSAQVYTRGRDAHPGRRGRDDHPPRPARPARARRVRGRRRGAGRRGGGRARPRARARPRRDGREDAAARRDRRGAARSSRSGRSRS